MSRIKYNPDTKYSDQYAMLAKMPKITHGSDERISYYVSGYSFTVTPDAE